MFSHSLHPWSHLHALAVAMVSNGLPLDTSSQLG